MDNEKFVIKPENIKKMHQEKVVKEQLLFLALCSEKDRQFINGELKLPIGDFERISYLLDSMGLDNYLISFEMKHTYFMNQLYSQIKTNSDEYVKGKEDQVQAEVSKLNRWLQDFCHQLPSPEQKLYFKRLFELD